MGVPSSFSFSRQLTSSITVFAPWAAMRILGVAASALISVVLITSLCESSLTVAIVCRPPVEVIAPDAVRAPVTVVGLSSSIEACLNVAIFVEPCAFLSAS